MPDPLIDAAHEVLDDTVAAMRVAIEGAPPDVLNARPAGEQTNSIAVLAVHVMHSARSWLCVATGAPRPQRDRDSEFVATAADAPELLAVVDRLHADCRRILAEAEQVDWAAQRETHPRPGGRPTTVGAAWALLHAIEHLGTHGSQVSLTRQMLDPAWSPPED